MICYRAGNLKASNGRRRSTFTGNSALLPSDAIDVRNVARSEFLAGSSFIVRCHVTSKLPMRERALGKKFPAI